MPRLNIYIPDDLDLALRTSPHDINISKVCAAAIRAELAARSDDRSAPGLFSSALDEPGWLDVELMRRFHLRRSVSGDSPDGSTTPRDEVSHWTAAFLDRAFSDGLDVAIGGGVQMWTTIRRLSPRNLGMGIWALGYGQVDHALPHAHPNALVTLLSLMYAPRSSANLVNAPRFRQRWVYPASYPPGEPRVRRIVVGSCAPFDAESPYAQLLGKEMTDFLMEENVVGDFLGVFITADGRLIEPYSPQMTVSHIPSSDLRELSKRDDTIVLLASGGGHKVRLIRLVLEAGLCNSMITDVDTSYELLGITARLVEEE